MSFQDDGMVAMSSNNTNVDPYSAEIGLAVGNGAMYDLVTTCGSVS